MSETNKKIRVRANVGGDATGVVFELGRDINNIEILSLSIDAEGMYKRHTSDYGCIAGRVLANDAVGVPNARVSVFISADNEWLFDSVMSGLYPYTSISGRNSDLLRYNLLPDYQVSDCHQPVGSFPSKRVVLDDNNIIEVYDKFYKYTTRTNGSGDYMLFGVPVGNQTIHVDVDLSDIGFLSQTPRDMIYKGYDKNQFENSNKFKASTNLDGLAQIISENKNVYVYPFWGDDDTSDNEYAARNDANEVKITRNDVNVTYEFTPTCVFMGSMVTDDKSNGITEKCLPTENMGKMDKLTTGSGTIEMIRYRLDGNIEEFQIQGNELIDGNGVWCYQIPMNLDYVKTDEYGNLVPCKDPNKGIPTRAKVRFRMSISDFESDYEANHFAKVLVPNNPKTYEDLEETYHFGSKTSEDSFRNLFWNNVYTVKSYIPRIQKGNVNWNKKFSGFKAVNINGNNNPIPYNNMRVRLNFQFSLQCAIMKCLIWVIRVVNFTLGIFFFANRASKYLTIGDGVCPDMEGWYFAPGARVSTHRQKNLWKKTFNELKDDSNADPSSIDGINNDDDEKICLTNNRSHLLQCIEISLAMEYEVIKFDFYNDWINGMLYIPRWFAKIKRRKRKRAKKKNKLYLCGENNYHERRFVQQCALSYALDGNDNDGYTFTKVTTKDGCHKTKNDKYKCQYRAGRKYVKIFNKKKVKGGGGLVHEQETMRKEHVYYFKPCEFRKSKYDSKYENRCILFATDLVLLGSLNTYDRQGLPSAFKYLTSTSYLLPPTIASTNMDEVGYMWSHDGKSCICNNKKVTSAVQPIEEEQTFDTFVEWSKGKDYYEKDPDDETEYAVTETAGIDWGYSGPGQGKKDEKNFYTPGGHFLGISCRNSQVNIKSCVNLSRICEIGSSLSSRDYIAVAKGDELDYVYTVPTGLISREGIIDNKFRSMFATLNMNGLKTKVDSGTRHEKYDFISINPTNYSGELKNRIQKADSKSKNGLYNSKESFNDDIRKNTQFDTQAIKLTQENTSIDYYRFRFGITDPDIIWDRKKAITEQPKHFLVNENDGSVGLPVYENSFYFYFGLKQGNTSLDKLFTDFSGECAKIDEDDSFVNITPTDENFCSERTGTVRLSFNNVPSPYTVNLEDEDGMKYSFTKRVTEEETYFDEYVATVASGSVNELFTTRRTIEILGLTGYRDANNGEYGVKRYTLYLEDAEGEEHTATFDIGVKMPNFSDLTITTIDYPDKYVEGGALQEYDKASTGRRNGGFIDIIGLSSDIKGYAVETDEYFLTNRGNTYYVNNGKLDITDGNGGAGISYSGDIGAIHIPAWRMNDTYYITLYYECSNGVVRPINLANVQVNGTMALDVYIGDNDLLFRRDIEGMTDDTTLWYRKMLNAVGVKGDDGVVKYEVDGKIFTEKQIWNVKKALFFQQSVYSFEGDNILVGPTGGSAPYNEFLLVTGERALDDENDEDHTYIDVTDSRWSFITNKTEFKELEEAVSGNGITLRSESTMKFAYDLMLQEQLAELFESNPLFALENKGPIELDLERESSYTFSLKNQMIPDYGFVFAYGNSKEVKKNNGGNRYNDYHTNVGFAINGEHNLDYKFWRYGVVLKQRVGNTTYVSNYNGNTSKIYSFQGPKNGSCVLYTDSDGSMLPSGKTISADVKKQDKDNGGLVKLPETFITTPSIYEPFFFTANLFIDKENKVNFYGYIVNGVTYEGKFNKVELTLFNQILKKEEEIIRTSDISYDDEYWLTSCDLGYAKFENFVTSECIIEDIDTGERPYGNISDFNLNFTVQEGSPAKYEGEIEPLETKYSMKCGFVTGDGKQERHKGSLRTLYFSIDGDFDYEQFIIDGGIYTIYEKEKSKFVKYFLTKKGYTIDEIFNMLDDNEGINVKDTNKENTYSKINKALEGIFNKSRTVIGMYDTLDMSGVDHTTLKTNNIFDRYVKHTNFMRVFKEYGSFEEFSSFIQHLYVDGENTNEVGSEVEAPVKGDVGFDDEEGVLATVTYNVEFDWSDIGTKYLALSVLAELSDTQDNTGEVFACVGDYEPRLIKIKGGETYLVYDIDSVNDSTEETVRHITLTGSKGDALYRIQIVQKKNDNYIEQE